MTAFEPSGKLQIARAGDIIIISEAPLPQPPEKLDGVQIVTLLSKEGQRSLLDWIASVEISDIQKSLEIGRGTAGRLKKALGLSESYDGESQATKYRRERAKLLAAEHNAAELSEQATDSDL